MTRTDPRTDAFFAEAKRWQAELAALRAILIACPVEEEFKWRAPCYTSANGNVATIGGLRDRCVLSFFKGVLLHDTAGILIAPGENSRSVRMVAFTSVQQIATQRPILIDYITQAIEIELARRKVLFQNDDLALPAEFAERLAVDPALSAAFDALTPGRQRGYVLHFAQPRLAQTRAARVVKSIPRILAGKGRQDR